MESQESPPAGFDVNLVAKFIVLRFSYEISTLSRGIAAVHLRSEMVETLCGK